MTGGSLVNMTGVTRTVMKMPVEIGSSGRGKGEGRS